ncbi:MAG: ASCH domain-containing protein [Fermentimonas sp.]|nr:ASCH domain-containing protein [Fermentimonas sp.]
MKPAAEDTLLLAIKPECFSAIISGKKKTEAREIKDTTFKKYLKTWTKDGNVGLLYDKSLLSGNPVSEIYIYNNGIYPYIPISYKYLSMMSGISGEGDILIVEIDDITFEPVLQKNGYPIRFNIIDDDFKPCKNGDYCFWNIVYHFGKVIEIKHRKSGKEHII